MNNLQSYLHGLQIGVESIVFWVSDLNSDTLDAADVQIQFGWTEGEGGGGKAVIIKCPNVRD